MPYESRSNFEENMCLPVSLVMADSLLAINTRKWLSATLPSPAMGECSTKESMGREVEEVLDIVLKNTISNRVLSGYCGSWNFGL